MFATGVKIPQWIKSNELLVCEEDGDGGDMTVRALELEISTLASSRIVSKICPSPLIGDPVIGELPVQCVSHRKALHRTDKVTGHILCILQERVNREKRASPWRAHVTFSEYLVVMHCDSG